MSSPFTLPIAPQSDGTISLLAGEVPPSGLVCPPFGETPFMELITVFSRASLKAKDAGAQYLSLMPMSTARELRAAIFGAWHAKLPVLANITVSGDDTVFGNCDVLAVLLIAQAMGAGAVKLTGEISEDLPAELAPFTKIPVIYTGEDGKTRLLDDIGVEKQPQPGELILCSQSEVFYLDEDYELSPPITCGLNMEDEIIAAQDEGCDVLLVHLTTNEDGYCFAQSEHMASLPVCFIAETEEALEAGLIYYSGIAIIDSRSEVPPEQLEALAHGYGAVIR